MTPTTAHDLRSLAQLPRAELEAAFAAGSEPDPADLVGWVFRGVAPARPYRAIGASRFAKGFYEGDRGPAGFNLLCSQRDWRPRRIAGRMIRHSYFDLRTDDGVLVFDYVGSPRNPSGHPARLFHDVLVHPDPANRDLLLGRAYLRLGRLVHLAYFVLERDHPLEEAP